MSDENTELKYLKTRLEEERKEKAQLQDFKHLVKSIVENLYWAVIWTWVILGIGCPVLVYFHPLPQDSIIQALILAATFWILYAMAHAMRAIGRIDKI